MALKAFVEGIRLSVLTGSALQQLQLEILSLRQALPRYAALPFPLSKSWRGKSDHSRAIYNNI